MTLVSEPITATPSSGLRATPGFAPGATATLSTEPEEIAFDINHFSLWYSARQALYDVSIKIPAKKVTAIIGPSGCGKSTFLRALNRMHEMTPGTRLEGSLRLFGDDLYASSVEATVVRRRVGMVFQKSNPFPTMTIAENVLVGLRLNGIRDKAILEERLVASLKMAAAGRFRARAAAAAWPVPCRAASYAKPENLRPRVQVGVLAAPPA